MADEETPKKPTISDLFQVTNKNPSNITIRRSVDLQDVSEKEEEDLGYARCNVLDLLEVGQEAISNLSVLANQSQQAGTYEVLATFIKTMITANHQLLDIHEKNRNLRGQSKEKEPTKVTNQNLIVSSEEMQKIIEKMKKKD